MPVVQQGWLAGWVYLLPGQAQLPMSGPCGCWACMVGRKGHKRGGEHVCHADDIGDMVCIVYMIVIYEFIKQAGIHTFW